MNKYFPTYHAQHLASVIREIKPDVIHSLEILLAGQLVFEAKKHFKNGLPRAFPIWITTSWGLDVYFFGRLKKNFPKVKEVLSSCDYFSCECRRDAKLAENYGLKPDQVVAVYPNTGGFDLKKIKSLRAKGKTSARRLIMLKGYQNLYGRALVALRAMERCHELLKDYKIMIYGMPPGSSLEIAAELFSQRTGVPTEIIPFNSPHETILKYHGKSRISISTNAADGVNTAFLESIVMGSFPIQSNTACADEWVQDGKTGFIVPPEDPEVVEVAFRKALTNDRLVDEGAKLNWETTLKRLNFVILKKKTIELYQEVIKRGKYPRK